MRNTLVLAVREWKAFWYSPIAYAVGACFMVFQGIVFMMLVAFLNDPSADPSWSVAHLFFTSLFFWISMLVMPPLLTMRAFSEEKRTGTIELLLSAPVTDGQVVIGKFLGAWISFCLLWATTLVFFLLLARHIPLDWGPIASGYLGTVLLGAAFIAIGLFASSLTRNQVIAAVVTFVLLIVLFVLGFLDYFFRDPDTARLIQYVSCIGHFQDFSMGSVDTRPIVFDLSLTIASLFLTTKALMTPRWRL